MVASGPHANEAVGIHRTGNGHHRHVLLIHGALDRAAGMALVARRLAPHCDVTRYDRRGYASRWQDPGPFTIEAHVHDAIGLLDGRPSWIVGHSLGGDIALAVADRRPDLVRGVTIYETPLSWMDFWPKETAGASSMAVGPEQGAEAFMVRMIGQRRWDELPERTKEARRREGRALVEELSSLRERAPWSADGIACRVIAGRGEKAAPHHVRGMQWVADNVAGAQLRILAGAGHGAPTTHAHQFVDELVLPHFVGEGTFTVTS